MLARALLPILVVSSAAALQTTEPPATELPANFKLRFEWKEASLPPPYHYEYELRVRADGRGTIDFLPDYPMEETPVWRETFEVERDRLAALWARLGQLGFFEAVPEDEGPPSVGGRFVHLEVTTGERRWELSGSEESGHLVELREILEALVPAALWESLKAKRQAYFHASSGAHGEQVH